jgi:hypothetical protein
MLPLAEEAVEILGKSSPVSDVSRFAFNLDKSKLPYWETEKSEQNRVTYAESLATLLHSLGVDDYHRKPKSLPSGKADETDMSTVQRAAHLVSQ